MIIFNFVLFAFLLKALLNLLDLGLEGRHHSGIGFHLLFI